MMPPRDIPQPTDATAPIDLSAPAYRRVASVIPRLLSTATLDGAFTSVSEAWPSYTHMAAPALLGWGWLQAVHPDERAGLAEACRASAKGGRFTSREVCLREGRTGQYKAWLIHGNIEYDQQGAAVQWLISLTDIDAQKKVQRRVRDKEERLRLVLDRTPILILCTDRVGTVTEVSGLALSIVKRTREDYLGHNICEMTRVYPEVQAALVAALAGTPREADVHMRGRDWQMNLVPNREGAGQPAGITAMFIDITERREALNLAVTERAAREASQAKGVFLANMSHEVRTPLAGILGVAELLADTPLDAKQAQYLGMIREAGQGLLNVINDILNFSKGNQPARARLNVMYSPAKIVRTQVDMMRPPAAHKGVHLKTHIDADVPAEVFGDSGRVAQVLLNLLSNAIKFTPKGQVELGVACDGAERLRFYVKDSGIGLSAEAQGRLFQPYTQADAGIAQVYGGTGLGLAISRDLVRQMGGDIGVESALGAGATFSVTLPLRSITDMSGQPATPKASQREPTLAPLLTDTGATISGSPATAAAIATAAAATEPNKGRGATAATAAPPPRILVVEDNKTNQLLMQAQLKKLGATCQIVNQGLEALEALKAQAFELILMDCQMPEMDGYAATRAIRAQEAGTGKHVPIVAVTANVMPEDQALCVSAGMDAYLAKPFSREELKQVLTRWLPAG